MRVVIIEITDYLQTFLSILSETSKFITIELASLLKLENQINRIIRPSKSCIGEAVYESIFPSGSQPGRRLHGLPKVHKFWLTINAYNLFNQYS